MATVKNATKKTVDIFNQPKNSKAEKTKAEKLASAQRKAIKAAQEAKAAKQGKVTVKQGADSGPITSKKGELIQHGGADCLRGSLGKRTHAIHEWFYRTGNEWATAAQTDDGANCKSSGAHLDHQTADNRGRFFFERDGKGKYRMKPAYYKLYSQWRAVNLTSVLYYAKVWAKSENNTKN